MPAIIDKLLRIGEGKILRQLEAVSSAVSAIENDFTEMSDAELQGMTAEFRERLAVAQAVAELGGHAAELVVAHRDEVVLDGVDRLHDGFELTKDLALADAEQLVDDGRHEW